MNNNYNTITGNAWMMKARENTTNKDMLLLCREYARMYAGNDLNYAGLIALHTVKWFDRYSNKPFGKAPRRLINETVAAFDTLDRLRSLGLLVLNREEAAR